MADKYDDAIAYLTAHPDEISSSGGAWGNPKIHPAGCLFSYAAADSETLCGCLTQIRSDPDWWAETQELTEAIRADDRIPLLPEDITVADLPVFAEWQRRLDKELGRC